MSPFRKNLLAATGSLAVLGVVGVLGTAPANATLVGIDPSAAGLAPNYNGPGVGVTPFSDDAVTVNTDATITLTITGANTATFSEKGVFVAQGFDKTNSTDSGLGQGNGGYNVFGNFNAAGAGTIAFVNGGITFSVNTSAASNPAFNITLQGATEPAHQGVNLVSGFNGTNFVAGGPTLSGATAGRSPSEPARSSRLRVVASTSISQRCRQRLGSSIRRLFR